MEPSIFFNSQPFWGTPTGLDTYAWSCFRSFEGAAIRQGEIPFWNPYVLNGVPWQGWITNVLHPGSLLHWLDLGPSQFCKVSLYCALVWAYLGGALWCKDLGRSDLAASCSGLLFAHSGLVMGQLYAGHLEIVVAMSWAPWLAWAGERYWRSPNLFGALSASAAGALLMLSGSMQIFYLSYSAVSLHGFLTACFYGQRCWKRSLLALAGWLASCALILLLTLFQWWPLLQAREFCNRPINDPDYFTSFAGRPENLLSWLLPHFFDSSNYDQFWTNGAYWEGCEYLGLLGLTFFVAGLVRGGQRRGPSLVLMIVACLIAYDSSSTLLKAYVNLGLDPAASQFRCPSRFLFWLHLYASPLVASGLDGWLKREQLVCRWIQRCLVAIFLCYFWALCLLEVLSPTNSVWVAFCRALFESQALSETSVATLYVSQYGRALWMFFLSFCMLVGWRYLDRELTSGRSLSASRMWIVLALLALDLASIVKPWLTTASEGNFSLAAVDVQTVRQSCPVGRRFEMPLPNVLQGMTMSKEELSGFLPITSLAYQEFWRTAMKRWRPNLVYQSLIVVFVSPVPPPLATFFGCNDAFPTKNRLEHWKSQFPQLSQVDVNPGGWELQPYTEEAQTSLLHFQRAQSNNNSRFLFHRSASFLPAQLIYARLSKSSHQSELWLSQPLQNSPKSDSSSSSPDWSIKNLELGVNRLEVEVSCSQSGYFTTKDAYWPGWQAWVDGTSTEVTSSYAGLCRTIWLPAGQHQVKFRFRPQHWDQLLRISQISWLLVLSSWGWLAWRRANRMTTQIPITYQLNCLGS